MMKFFYLGAFVLPLLAVDAAFPIAEEPMWRQATNLVAAVPAMMRAHEAADVPISHGGARRAHGYGVKPLFGDKGYVETGLPTTPMFDWITKEIEAGEEQAKNFTPPRIEMRQGPALPDFSRNIQVNGDTVTIRVPRR